MIPVVTSIYAALATILVLVLAFALDMLWVGVFSVMAMSLVTGIALIAMGIVVIKARQ